MHLVPGKLSSVMVYLYDASLTTVRLEMPKRQIDKTIARLPELKIAYYLLLTIISLAHRIEYESRFINRLKFTVTSMK